MLWASCVVWCAALAITEEGRSERSVCARLRGADPRGSSPGSVDVDIARVTTTMLTEVVHDRRHWFGWKEAWACVYGGALCLSLFYLASTSQARWCAECLRVRWPASGLVVQSTIISETTAKRWPLPGGFWLARSCCHVSHVNRQMFHLLA